MKILKNLTFLVILSGIFFIIYPQSDEKGFRRWRVSFKIALISAAITSGLITLISGNIEVGKPPGNNNHVYQERLFSDQEFNSFEGNDRKVILVKTGGSGGSAPSVPISPGRGQPSQFPTPPPEGRPSPPSRPVYKLKYRPAVKPKATPGMGAGGPEFDDPSPVPEKKQQNQTENKEDLAPSKNKKKKDKKEAEQCELIEVVSKINEDAGLVRAAEEACKNDKVQNDLNHMEKQLAKGNLNPGISRKALGKGIIEYRTKNGGRLYARESDGGIEILAKSGKKPKNQQFVIDRLKEIYG